MRSIGVRIWMLAVAAGMLLSALWLRSDWAAISHSVLPDSDDMVRLAQVRDWLAGQRFGDLVQHRLGEPQAPALHWSRIGDLGLAAFMLMLRPVLGAAQGDVWATILWPLTVFILYLGASARLAARLCGRDHAAIAIILAAFAFPAITMFVPGRIDHHALQIVLTLVLAEAIMRPPTTRSGTIMGLAVAIMLAIGLETAPLCLTAMAVLFVLWALHGEAERRRVLAFGAVLGGATLLWRAVARPEFWSTVWCDGFTPASFAATLVATGFWLLLAGATQHVRDWRMRAGAGLVLGLVALAITYRTSSVCLTGPYGPVDPLMQRLWLDRVEEARGLFADGIGQATAFGGLALAALLALAVFLIRERRREWAILLAFQIASVAVMLVQIRGAVLATALAAPVMTHLVVLARQNTGQKGGLALLVGAWLVSAGLAWSIGGRLLSPGSGQAAAMSGADCTAATTLDQLAALPPGTMIAPIDAGAYLLGKTRHRVLAAPYHRNNLGNRTAYDFWLAAPDTARAIAVHWRADYVLACPNAFGGIDLNAEGSGGMAMLLEAGETPDWLQPVPLKGSAARLYRVLPVAPARR